MAKKKSVNLRAVKISLAVIIAIAVLIILFFYIKNPYEKQGAGSNASIKDEGVADAGSQQANTTAQSPASGGSSVSSDSGSSGNGGSSSSSGGSGRANENMNENASAGASSYNISIAKANFGTGSGIISSTPAGISCGAICKSAFAAGSSVTLTATPNEGSNFTEWAGDCASAGASASCTLIVNSNKNVDRIFDAIIVPTFNVSISKTGSGGGTVTSSGDPQLINCGTMCEAAFASGSSITLTAVSDVGSIFKGWSACAGTETCTITLDSDREVIATFDVYRRLTIQKSGAGTGTITSDPSGIDCGSTCNNTFSSGASIILTATPGYKSTFAGWTSGCDYILSGMCYVILSSDRTVKVQFS